MSLYVRILSKGHYNIMSALFLARKRERSFISALQADLKFPVDLGGVFEAFRGKSIAEWTSYLCNHSRHFLNHASEALGSEGAIFRDTPPSKNTTPTQENTPFSCQDCPKCFNSFQQLQLHRFSKHGCVHPLHMAAKDTHCPICLLQFHTRHRLLEHIKYKGKKRHCTALLSSRPPIFSEAEARELDADAAKSARQLAHRGLRRTHAAKPSHREPGPMWPLSHKPQL